MLRSVRAHLQPQYTLCLLKSNVSEDNVAAVQRFRTYRQTAMHNAVTAVLHYDIAVWAVFRHGVRPCSFATFQYNGIIVDRHVAVVYKHIMTNINVYSIGRRRPIPVIVVDFYAVSGRTYMTFQIPYMVATIEMIGPKRGIDEADVLYCNIFGV